ncbi:MAG: hypothetical protein MUO40_14220 [Anaerolineaceae bacterium]|nr:hypothetical protein [Anaerolineaceae bacterium]
MASTVEKVENQLVRDLPQIHPNPSFVGELKERLAKSPVFQYRYESSARTVFILIGLLIALLLFVLGLKINHYTASKKST